MPSHPCLALYLAHSRKPAAAAPPLLHTAPLHSPPRHPLHTLTR